MSVLLCGDEYLFMGIDRRKASNLAIYQGVNKVNEESIEVLVKIFMMGGGGQRVAIRNHAVKQLMYASSDLFVMQNRTKPIMVEVLIPTEDEWWSMDLHVTHADIFGDEVFHFKGFLTRYQNIYPFDDGRSVRDGDFTVSVNPRWVKQPVLKRERLFPKEAPRELALIR